MRMSDWSSDVCSSDLVRWPGRCRSGAGPALRGRWRWSVALHSLRRRVLAARRPWLALRRAPRDPGFLVARRDRLGRSDSRARGAAMWLAPRTRTEEHKSELQSLMRISYAAFCLKKKHNNQLLRHYSLSL